MKDLLQSDSAFIARIPEGGWRVTKKTPGGQFPGSSGSNSGMVEIMKGGRIGLIGDGTTPWSFNHPGVHQLYDEARLTLWSQGFDLPFPNPRYPRLEQLILQELNMSPVPNLARLRRLQSGFPVLCFQDYRNHQTRPNEPHAQAIISRFSKEAEFWSPDSMPLVKYIQARRNDWTTGLTISLKNPILICSYHHYDPRRMQIDVIERDELGSFSIGIPKNQTQWTGNIIPLEESTFQHILELTDSE